MVQLGANHEKPFHPSPYESSIESVQSPGATPCTAEYGAPPMIIAPSPSQESDQDTSVGNWPPLTVTLENTDGEGNKEPEPKSPSSSDRARPVSVAALASRCASLHGGGGGAVRSSGGGENGSEAGTASAPLRQPSIIRWLSLWEVAMEVDGQPSNTLCRKATTTVWTSGARRSVADLEWWRVVSMKGSGSVDPGDVRASEISPIELQMVPVEAVSVLSASESIALLVAVPTLVKRSQSCDATETRSRSRCARLPRVPMGLGLGLALAGS